MQPLVQGGSTHAGEDRCILHLKVDFPSGPSKKTGYSNIHFFSELREIASIVCSNVYS